MALSKEKIMNPSDKIVTYSEYCLAADCIAQKDADPEKARALQRMVAAYESM